MFVQGILQVQEEPYRNELDLRLLDGETIFLFYQPPRERRQVEEEDAFDALLESGKFYELLITVRVRQVIYSPTVPSGTSFTLVSKEQQGATGIFKHTELLQGTILDPSWDATQRYYLAVTTLRLYEQRYVLLNTAIGNVVISHAALRRAFPQPLESLAIGGYLQWAPSRLDVLAIIEKYETPPPDAGHLS